MIRNLGSVPCRQKGKFLIEEPFTTLESTDLATGRSRQLSRTNQHDGFDFNSLIRGDRGPDGGDHWIRVIATISP